MPSMGSAAEAEIPKSKYPDWLQRLLVCTLRCILFIVQRTPAFIVRFVAQLLGRLIYYTFGLKCCSVGRHLQIAFASTLDRDAQKKLARAFWIHFFEFIFETARLPLLNRDNVSQYVDCSEFESAITAYQKSNEGVLVVSGHIGSFEYGPYAMALKGHPVNLIHNAATMPRLHYYLKRLREASGMRLYDRDTHPWRFRNLLKNGATVVIAADLNAGRRGSFYPFFGVQASTYTTPACLAQAARCPILVVTTAREKTSFKMRVWKTIPFEKVDLEAERIATVTQQINQALEQAIRAYPEQWFWHYRRWRSRPKDESSDDSGLPPRVHPAIPPLC